jgi:hypothetical protein
MDLLDVTTVSDRANGYVLAVVNYFTKYTEAYASANKTATSMADCSWNNGFQISISGLLGLRT